MIEGKGVLKDVDVPRACVLLMWLKYALNLSYAKELKNTFEVFQMIFLELDGLKASPKVKPTVVLESSSRGNVALLFICKVVLCNFLQLIVDSWQFLKLTRIHKVINVLLLDTATFQI